MLLQPTASMLNDATRSYTKRRRINQLKAHVLEVANMTEEDFNNLSRFIVNVHDAEKQRQTHEPLEDSEIHGCFHETLSIENFRCFCSTQKMEFSIDKKRPVTLLISTNGTGKTSFLNSIVWCLFGELVHGTDLPDKLVNDEREEDASSAALVRLEMQIGSKLTV